MSSSSTFNTLWIAHQDLFLPSASRSTLQSKKETTNSEVTMHQISSILPKWLGILQKMVVSVFDHEKQNNCGSFTSCNEIGVPTWWVLLCNAAMVDSSTTCQPANIPWKCKINKIKCHHQAHSSRATNQIINFYAGALAQQAISHHTALIAYHEVVKALKISPHAQRPCKIEQNDNSPLDRRISTCKSCTNGMASCTWPSR